VKANFRSGEIVRVIDKIEEGRSIVPCQKKTKYDGIGTKKIPRGNKPPNLQPGHRKIRKKV